jgi:hypothetical protein
MPSYVCGVIIGIPPVSRVGGGDIPIPQPWRRYSASMPIFFISVAIVTPPNAMSLRPQEPLQHPASRERVVEMQFVDPAHQPGP